MLFSEKFGITLNGTEDWFDPVLDNDTRLFIDPMLVFQNSLEEFQGAKEKIRNFFQIAFEKVILAKGHLGPEREDALQMLRFKEVPENLLGYSNYGSKGSGMGKAFSQEVFNAMIELIDMGLEDIGSYLSTFEMFVEGIGRDRISDMISNILKEDLITYTRKICIEHKIPVTHFLINNYSYDKVLGWTPKRVDLPKNPYEKNQAILLVPKEFLRADSVIDIKDLEMYLSQVDNAELRKQASRLFTLDLDRAKLREAVRQDPQTVKKILEEYIKAREKEKNLPYDFRNDPNLFYWFNEAINKLKDKLPKIETGTKDISSLKNFVEGVLKQFKFIVEGREGYRLLFNDDDNPKEEKASQILFWGIAETMCKLNGSIVLCREGLTGRGPVDFRFSEGYDKKIHVEIKLAKNNALYTGLEGQLITYMKADQVEFGYYAVIKLLAGDNARTIRLQDKYEKIEEPVRNKLGIYIIDAYPETKASASKYKSLTRPIRTFV